MAYGGFRNCTRQNHGTAGNREAGGFVNSAVMYKIPIVFPTAVSGIVPGKIMERLGTVRPVAL